MLTYYDAHTHHHSTNQNGIVSVQNIRIGSDNNIPSGIFSAGIHPYDVEKFEDEWMEQLKEIAQNTKCVAIGECGIDKRFNNLEEQINIFRFQIDLAKELQKPLIVHCVKGLNEVLNLTKGFEYPMLLHSFHKWDEMIERRGNIFVSLSMRNIIESKRVKLDRLLLETDDSNYTIEEIYKRLSVVYGVELEDLVKQIEENFNNFYSI